MGRTKRATGFTSVWLLLMDDNHVEVEGTTTVGKLVASNASFAVVKEPDTHVFRGQGRPQGYAPARFVLYKILQYADDGAIEARRELEWPVRG